jgi:hypothetical protein
VTTTACHAHVSAMQLLSLIVAQYVEPSVANSMGPLKEVGEHAMHVDVWTSHSQSSSAIQRIHTCGPCALCHTDTYPPDVYLSRYTQMNWARLTERVLKLALPNMYCWLVGGFVVPGTAGRVPAVLQLRQVWLSPGVHAFTAEGCWLTRGGC